MPLPSSSSSSPAYLRQPQRHRADPGASVVAALGGPTAVARLLGISPSTVLRWGMARRDGGTDGRIPERHHAALRRIAERAGVHVDLTAPPARLAQPTKAPRKGPRP